MTGQRSWKKYLTLVGYGYRLGEKKGKKKAQVCAISAPARLDTTGLKRSLRRLCFYATAQLVDIGSQPRCRVISSALREAYVAFIRESERGAGKPKKKKNYNRGSTHSSRAKKRERKEKENARHPTDAFDSRVQRGSQTHRLGL